MKIVEFEFNHNSLQGDKRPFANKTNEDACKAFNAGTFIPNEMFGDGVFLAELDYVPEAKVMQGSHGSFCVGYKIEEE